MTLFDVIAALKLEVDADGGLVLDRAQTDYLFYLLTDIADAGPLKFAIADLMGALRKEDEESA